MLRSRFFHFIPFELKNFEFYEEKFFRIRSEKEAKNFFLKETNPSFLEKHLRI